MDDGSEPTAQTWFWRVWTLIGAVALLVGAWFVLHEPLRIVLPPIALAAIIVYLMNPTVTGMARRGIPRVLGVTIAYLFGIGAIIGLGIVLGPILVRQTSQFLDELPQIWASLQDAVNVQFRRFGIPGPLLSFDLSSPETQETVRGWLDENRDQLLNILRGAGTFLGRVFHLLLTLVLGPILAFYVLADFPRIRDGVKRLVPPGNRSEVLDVTGRITSMVGSYFRGQLLVAAFVGVATALALAVIGLPFWALIGIASGLFNLVPLIGPFVGGVVGVTVALTVGGGFGQAVAVVVAMTIVQQIDNHAITPNILARTVEVHPVTVILALLVAGSMYGILGMFLAIPAVAAMKLMVVYVLVTRVPSMRHLAGEAGLFDADGKALDPEGEDAPDGTLVGLGRELRRTWERRRTGRGSHEPGDETELPRDLIEVGDADQEQTGPQGRHG